MTTPANVLPAPHAEPAALSERRRSLDVLRGFAVLGILVMNIQSFSMVDSAYFNPTVAGDLTGINFAVWLVSHLFADMKFMTIFSMLFGAGIVLFCARAEQRGVRPARLHYRRTLWLLLFGLLHGYLLWVGDILVWYSFSGLLAYLFWRVRPGWLLFWSLLLLSIGSGLYLFFQWSLPYWPPESADQNAAMWNPAPEIVAARVAAYRGGWLSQMTERAVSVSMLNTFAYLVWGLWRTLGLMLGGMAFLKWGILTAERSRRFYVTTLAAGLAMGLPIIAYGAQQHFEHGWSMRYSMFLGSQFNYWGSLLVATAYIAGVMLIYRAGRLVGAQRRLELVGRMAFSSYILQTVICTTVFYGHGLGLYGSVPRWGQALIVVAVWMVVIAAAEVWLARFRFGPLEWLWRSLTYRERQPLRLAGSDVA
jgi:uncharacterized protein